MLLNVVNDDCMNDDGMNDVVNDNNKVLHTIRRRGDLIKCV